MNKILAVVVTYNRIELLKECLSALFSQSKKDFDVLVVNNASSDGTAEYLSTLDIGNLYFINKDVNDGGAGGFCDGMQYAVSNNYEYVWAMDDDTIPTVSALSSLWQASEFYNGEYGFLASRSLFTDGTLAVMNNCLLPNGKTTESIDFSIQKDYFEILTATFVSLFVKTDIIKKYGLPVRELYLWSDDTEFTSRISKQEKCYFVPSSIVIHKMAKNEKPDLVTLSRERFDRMILNIRNRYYIARRDGFVKKLRFFARHFILLVRIVFKSKDLKMERIKTLFKGVYAGFKFKIK